MKKRKKAQSYLAKKIKQFASVLIYVLLFLWFPPVRWVLSYIGFWIMYFLNYYYSKIKNRIEVFGEENIPRDTGALLFSNHHTLIDSLFICGIYVRRRDMFFHQKRIPWNTPDAKNFFSHWLGKHIVKLLKCTPAKRKFSQPSEFYEQIERWCNIIKNNNILLYFEGGRSRCPDKPNEESIGICRKGVALTILKGKPKYSIPVRLVNIDKILPVTDKLSYKMSHGHKCKIIFGPPVDFSDIWEAAISDDEKIELIKIRVRQAVVDLAPDNNPE